MSLHAVASQGPGADAVSPASTGDARLPITLLTGFLGSGKTTLLRALLRHPELADTAVIVNEIGEIGLDHLLVDHLDENLRILNSGCLCCSMRGDLVDTLADLMRRRAAGEVAFSRVVIETTGMADPAPVLHTLSTDPALAAAYRLAGVVATVDAVNGASTLQRHVEASRQVAMADLVLLTKTDLASPLDTAFLDKRLASLNPTAVRSRAVNGEVSPDVVLRAGSVTPDRVFERDEQAAPHHYQHHDHTIRAHCFDFDESVPGDAFARWLELLASMRGERLLRVKGLVRVAEHPDEPWVVHGAQHLIHAPRRLPRWPSADRRTRLVFITQGVERAEIERTLHKFAGVTTPRAPSIPDQELP
jgi:G3E family GTPase